MKAPKFAVDGGSWMTRQAGDDLVFFTGGLQQLTLTPGGRLGLSVADPTARLDLRLGGETRALNSDADYGAGVGGSYAAHILNARYGPSSVGALTGLHVQVQHEGTGDSYAALFSGGKVGIGTTAPSRLLDVAGTARLSGLELPTGAAGGNGRWPGRLEREAVDQDGSQRGGPARRRSRPPGVSSIQFESAPVLWFSRYVTTSVVLLRGIGGQPLESGHQPISG